MSKLTHNNIIEDRKAIIKTPRLIKVRKIENTFSYLMRCHCQSKENVRTKALTHGNKIIEDHQPTKPKIIKKHMKNKI